MNDSPTKYTSYHEADMEAVYENATNGASVASLCNILRCHRSRLEGINNIDVMK